MSTSLCKTPLQENFATYSETRLKRLEDWLNQQLPAPQQTLFEALRYSVLDGGKRIRPLLVYITGEALGCPTPLLDAPAAAVELIHCYSLIHDDLPAMDNDTYRRGKLTCHKAFNESIAILAGDALLSFAFEILSNPKLNPVNSIQQIQMIATLSQKSGIHGMVEGQALDLAATNTATPISLSALEEIHAKKTGALIEASLLLGAIAAGFDIDQPDDKKMPLLNLKTYANRLGLAFQIQDDILDEIANTETLGKTSGKDKEQNKTTFTRLLGITHAKTYLEKRHEEALDALANIPQLRNKAHYFKEFAALLLRRTF